MTTAGWTTHESPIGILTLTASGAGLTGVHFPEEPPALAGSRARPGLLAAARRQLDEYFAGERRAFDLPLDLDAGTDFQRSVWRAVATIPHGATVTYGELARRSGRPGHARAAGGANARNPLPVIVPCHRVVGGDGALTGYAGGLDRKRLLLELEGSDQLALIMEPAKAADVAPLIVEAYGLTPRELEVTRAIARGLGTSQIAAWLHLSPHTVRDHVKAIFEKVGVSSRGELVAKVFADHYSPPLPAGAAPAARG